MRFLSNGGLVVADVGNGALLRIQPSGSSRVVLAGINYPNGVEVDKDDFVYVSEQNAGQVRRIHPYTGEYTIIAKGLFNPNGLSFSPDYKTLYVNSFGGGTVHRVTRNAQGEWAPPELLATIPGNGCAGRDLGASCHGGGTCMSDGKCSPPCSGKAAGNDCLGHGQCIDNGIGGLRCTFEPFDQGGSGFEFPFEENVCTTLSDGSTCTVTDGTNSFTGICTTDFGPRLCDTFDSIENACVGKTRDDECFVADPFLTRAIARGKCEDEGAGDGHLLCNYLGEMGGSGLDGLTVDACGNLYITEFGPGTIWRLTPDGELAQAAELDSKWIPNLHWGTGIGGWETDVLYVIDRSEEHKYLFELRLGVGEKERVFPK